MTTPSSNHPRTKNLPDDRPQPKQTYLINLISGPGSGKSTICALLFAKLKIKTHYSIEYIQEFAKTLVWEEDFELLDNQYWVSTKQFRLLNSLNHKIDLIITDGCLLHGIYYNRNNENNVSNVQKTEVFIKNSFNEFNNINIFLERSPTIEYEQAGRYQTEEEAKSIDLFFKNYLNQHQIPYQSFPVDGENNIDDMLDYILSQLPDKKEPTENPVKKPVEFETINLPA